MARWRWSDERAWFRCAHHGPDTPLLLVDAPRTEHAGVTQAVVALSAACSVLAVSLQRSGGAWRLARASTGFCLACVWSHAGRCTGRWGGQAVAVEGGHLEPGVLHRQCVWLRSRAALPRSRPPPPRLGPRLTPRPHPPSSAEFLVGYGLLTSFRQFERQRGSAKFAAHALACVGLSTALQVAAARLFSAALPAGCASGPYGLVFALAPLFLTDVPVTARFTLLQLPLTDKTFTWGALAQLACARGRASLAASACGLLAGMAVHGNWVGLGAWRGPQRLVDAVAAAGDWASRLLTRGAGHTHPQAQAAAPGVRHRPAAPPRDTQRSDAQQPSAEAVETLCNMGFERAAAQHALVLGGGDLTAAANLLLAG